MSWTIAAPTGTCDSQGEASRSIASTRFGSDTCTSIPTCRGWRDVAAVRQGNFLPCSPSDKNGPRSNCRRSKIKINIKINLPYYQTL